MQIKRTIRTWSDKRKDLFFKSTNQYRLSNIIIELILLSNSGWKNEFQKYSCLTLNKGMLLWFLVVRVDKTLEIIQSGKRGVYFFFLSLKNKHNLATQDVTLDRASLLRNL